MPNLKPLWACPNCDYEVRSDPLACDDWGGEERAIGPDCPDCECECWPVEENNP